MIDSLIDRIEEMKLLLLIKCQINTNTTIPPRNKYKKFRLSLSLTPELESRINSTKKKRTKKKKEQI